MDGGDISCVKFVATKLGCVIKDQTCVCHLLNGVIKRCVTDFCEDIYLIEWRSFIKRIRQSHPFAEAWEDCCKFCYKKKIVLQKDTETRWSSTVAMIMKACEVKEAVLSMSLKVSTWKEEDKVDQHLFPFIIIWIFILRSLFQIGEILILRLGFFWSK